MNKRRKLNIFERKFIKRVLLTVAVLLIGLCYYIYILTGHSGKCLFFEFFNLRCPSCGATTAVMALLDGEIALAISAHPAFILAVFPIGIIMWAQDFFSCLYGMIKRKPTCTLFEFLINKENKG